MSPELREKPRQAAPGLRPVVLVLLAGLSTALRTAGQDAPAPSSRPAETASQPATRPAGAALKELDEATDLLEMSVPTVVTAARRAQPITGVPYAMSVVTQEDLRRAGARSIPDALRLVPGVDVADLTGNNWAVSPRGVLGLLSNQVLVLVDGRQIFDSYFGGTLWGCWPFQLEDIERIEVIRGPAGVTWGANAVNGVINIITKDPADQQGLTFRGGGGSRGTQHEYLGYGLTDGKVRLRISGEYDANDGFVRGGSLLRPLADEVKSGRMTLHGIYEPGPRDTLTFSGGSAVNEGVFPTTPMAGFFGGGPNGSQANYLFGKWTHHVERDNTIQITGFVNDAQVSPGLKTLQYRYQQYALQFSHSFRPAEAHTVTWGVDTRGDVSDGSGGDPYMSRQPRVTKGIFGVYAADEWRLAPRWTLNLGGRIDYDTHGGFQPSGRVSLGYQATANTALYGAISRAFQMLSGAAPTVELPLLDGLAGMRVDPRLGTEGLIAYELGARGRYFEKLDVTANVFWHEFSDMYAFQPRWGPPGLLHLNLENATNVGLYGAELDAKYALTKSLTLLGNYTYEQLEWRSAGGIWQKDAMSPPHNKFMVGVRYDPFADLHLSGHLYYVDAVQAPNPPFPLVARDINEYFRLDLQAEYEFWNKRASLAIGVRNLLDDHHPEGASLFINSAEVPRMIYAELRVRLP